MNGKFPNRLASFAVIIYGITPVGLMTVCERLWSVSWKKIAVGAKVVVDDVQDNHQATYMRFLYQRFEIFGASVGRVGSVQKCAVIPPIPFARKIGDGHDFYAGDAEVYNVVEFFNCRKKRSFARESTDMKF